MNLSNELRGMILRPWTDLPDMSVITNLFFLNPRLIMDTIYGMGAETLYVVLDSSVETCDRLETAIIGGIREVSLLKNKVTVTRYIYGGHEFIGVAWGKNIVYFCANRAYALALITRHGLAL